MTAPLHPTAPHHLPAFISAPGEPDVLMAVMAGLLVLAVLAVGIMFFRLHTLPERIAHRSQKIQFEIVAVLGLLALFTHIHAFWVAGLLLALIDIPDFGWPLRRMAGSLEKIAGIPSGEGAVQVSDIVAPIGVPAVSTGATSDATIVKSPQAMAQERVAQGHALAGERT